MKTEKCTKKERDLLDALLGNEIYEALSVDRDGDIIPLSFDDLVDYGNLVDFISDYDKPVQKKILKLWNRLLRDAWISIHEGEILRAEQDSKEEEAHRKECASWLV